MNPQLIGKHHRRLAEIRDAFRAGRLTPDGLLPIEGIKLLDEAGKSGLKVQELFVREGDTCTVNVEQTRYVSPSVFRTLGATRASQGIIALVKPRTFSLESMLEVANPLLIVMCGLQDPGNVGNIMRTAEAFCASGCIATHGTVSVYNDKVVRASAGSLFRLPHVWGLSFQPVIDQLRSRGLRIVGTTTVAEKAIETEDWRLPSAILLGNEGVGLSPDEHRACDSFVRIPHAAAVDSLNAAIAAAIVLYEAARYRPSEVN